MWSWLTSRPSYNCVYWNCYIRPYLNLQQPKLDIAEAHGYRTDLRDCLPIIAKSEERTALSSLTLPLFTLCCFFPPLLLPSSLSRPVEPAPFYKEKLFRRSDWLFVRSTRNLWRTGGCVVHACVHPSHVSAGIANVSEFVSPPTPYWQVCPVCQIGVCKTHSANCVIGADIFLMSAICAHPASNQILPYLCVCVNKWAGWGKEGDFSCASPLLDVKVSNIFCLACGVLQAIQGGILLQLLPTPTCTKQAVLGIHQVSSTLLPIHKELIFNKVISWEKLSV